jgi:hypothetical protein
MIHSQARQEHYSSLRRHNQVSFGAHPSSNQTSYSMKLATVFHLMLRSINFGHLHLLYLLYGLHAMPLGNRHDLLCHLVFWSISFYYNVLLIHFRTLPSTSWLIQLQIFLNHNSHQQKVTKFCFKKCIKILDTLGKSSLLTLTVHNKKYWQSKL